MMLFEKFLRSQIDKVDVVSSVLLKSSTRNRKTAITVKRKNMLQCMLQK